MPALLEATKITSLIGSWGGRADRGHPLPRATAFSPPRVQLRGLVPRPSCWNFYRMSKAFHGTAGGRPDTPHPFADNSGRPEMKSSRRRLQRQDIRLRNGGAPLGVPPGALALKHKQRPPQEPRSRWALASDTWLVNVSYGLPDSVSVRGRESIELAEPPASPVLEPFAETRSSNVGGGGSRWKIGATRKSFLPREPSWTKSTPIRLTFSRFSMR